LFVRRHGKTGRNVDYRIAKTVQLLKALTQTPVIRFPLFKIILDPPLLLSCTCCLASWLET